MIKRIKKKYDNIPVQAKASLWYVSCSIINKAIQFVTIPLFTRLLTTEEYGLYTLFISWESIFLMIFSLNIQSNIFNNMLIKKNLDMDKTVSITMGLITFLSLCGLVIACVFKENVQSFTQLPISIVVGLLVCTMLISAYDLWAAKERFIFKYKKIVFVSLMVAIINPTIGLLFVKMFSGNKGIARIWAIIVGYVICYGLIFIRIFIKGKKVVDLKQWKYALGLALPLLPHYLSQTMLNQADRIMISRMIGLSEAAMYGVAYSISIVLLFVNKAIHNSFTPWIYRKLKAKDYSDISSIINKLLVGVCLLNSFIILFGPELVHILAPTTYAEASRIIAPVTVSSFLIFIYGLFCNLEFYFEKKFHMMIISVCGAVLNILLNYKFIPNFGYVAAGYTTLISYLFFVIAHYCVVRYIEKKYLESTRIYDVKFVFFICSCMIAFAEVINLFLNMYVVRYSVAILAMLIVIVLLKRTMKNKD